MKEMREIFGEALVELGRENEKIIVLDADLNTSTRTDLFKKERPSQFVQIGIAEQNMFGWAAGLATFGMIPFPTTFAVFATKRACDQVSISIAYPNLNVKIPGCYSGISTGKSGATHQSVEDLAIMRSMPNMRVLAPADGVELRQMMKAMVEYVGPVYFRVPRPAIPAVVPGDYQFDWQPVLLKEGKDVAMIATGYMTHLVVEAAQTLAAHGIDAAVIHVPCLKPLAPGLIVQAAKECGVVITVEDHSIIGGLGGAIAELLGEEFPVPMKRIGVRDKFVETGEDRDILTKYGLLPENIVQTAIAMMARKK